MGVLDFYDAHGLDGCKVKTAVLLVRELAARTKQKPHVFRNVHGENVAIRGYKFMASRRRQMRHHLKRLRRIQLGQALHHALADRRAEALQNGFPAVEKLLRLPVIVEYLHLTYFVKKPIPQYDTIFIRQSQKSERGGANWHERSNQVIR